MPCSVPWDVRHSPKTDDGAQDPSRVSGGTEGRRPSVLPASSLFPGWDSARHSPQCTCLLSPFSSTLQIPRGQNRLGLDYRCSLGSYHNDQRTAHVQYTFFKITDGLFAFRRKLRLFCRTFEIFFPNLALTLLTSLASYPPLTMTAQLC